ncbi:RimK family alpha-L-glutamate ligase [Streptomyces sp. NPDC127051]|uniref:ATP-grasp domain-containing protein n=1 Tax=Streptomyces sp. NPDC127051 TaxID=3347119 RepID=UPI0036642E84
MVMFLGSGADPTFRHTVTALAKRGIDGDIIDLGHLVLAGDFTLPLDGTPGTVQLAGETFHLTAPMVTRLIDISSAAPSKELAERARATQTSIARYLRTLPWEHVVGAPWDNSNFSKIFQLSLAGGRSWTIPETLVTNNPDAAREFARRHDVVYKGASSSKTWANVFQPTDAARLALLARAPALFQERVIGFDVRVHVVGNQVFGEAVHTDSCDYRISQNATFNAITVPPEVKADCVDLTRAMKLVLSGIDFKVTGDEEWFFLEANSSPCFQGYDRRAEGAISDALAEHLRTI